MLLMVEIGGTVGDIESLPSWRPSARWASGGRAAGTAATST